MRKGKPLLIAAALVVACVAAACASPRAPARAHPVRGEAQRFCPIVEEFRAPRGQFMCSESRRLCVNDRGWRVTREGVPVPGPCS